MIGVLAKLTNGQMKEVKLRACVIDSDGRLQVKHGTKLYIEVARMTCTTGGLLCALCEKGHYDSKLQKDAFERWLPPPFGIYMYWGHVLFARTTSAMKVEPFKLEDMQKYIAGDHVDLCRCYTDLNLCQQPICKSVPASEEDSENEDIDMQEDEDDEDDDEDDEDDEDEDET
jgi:hypothetical protein